MSIPTVYRKVNFRSMLEAHWAAFFDLVAWPWAYETSELAGYIPDFILGFPSPLLVEVKPAFSHEALAEWTGKPHRSGWTGEIMIAGGMPLSTSENALSVGILGERMESDLAWGPALIERSGDHYGLRHQHCDWRCRVCGRTHYAENSYDGARILRLWNQAANDVRWRWQQGAEA